MVPGGQKDHIDLEGIYKLLAMIEHRVWMEVPRENIWTKRRRGLRTEPWGSPINEGYVEGNIANKAGQLGQWGVETEKSVSERMGRSTMLKDI